MVPLSGNSPLIVAVVWMPPLIFYMESNNSPTIVGTAKLSGVVAADSNAHQRKIYSHALLTISAAKCVVIGSVNVKDKF